MNRSIFLGLAAFVTTALAILGQHAATVANAIG